MSMERAQRMGRLVLDSTGARSTPRLRPTNAEIADSISLAVTGPRNCLATSPVGPMR